MAGGFFGIKDKPIESDEWICSISQDRPTQRVYRIHFSVFSVVQVTRATQSQMTNRIVFQNDLGNIKSNFNIMVVINVATAKVWWMV